MIPIDHCRPRYPDYVADSILDVDDATLKRRGITHLVFDADDTLVHRGQGGTAPEYAAYIRSLKRKGFSILIGTNAKRDLHPLAENLGADVISPRRLSYKPFRSFYTRIIAAADTAPEHIAMIGDNIINDVVGANRAGLVTVLVRPLHGNPTPVYRFYMRRALRHARHVTSR
ncbi:MAG TPA: HAD hydrolase-like protein [Candidatus Saccharimonadales bacterium]|jgi:hypothetical protein